MNSGYDRYSMSNRAVDAYNDGRKPLSQFNSDDLYVFNVELQQEGYEVQVKSLAAFKRLLKAYGSIGEWHHTSSYFNKTNFYDPFNILYKLSGDSLISAINDANEPLKKEKIEIYEGNFEYLTWSGTKKHPKATKQFLTDVWIKEKGSFYYVYDKNGELLIKKKIGSNGTCVHKTLCI